MFIEPIATEQVYQISAEETLKRHFNECFSGFCESSEEICGLQRHVSGIPYPFLNTVLGTCEQEGIIEKQIEFFKSVKLPFVWYIDEASSPEFKTKLTKHGFQDVGIFQGVIGPLDKPFADPEIPEGCVIELVRDEEAMDAFNELVSSVFEIHGESKDLYSRTLWKLANTEPPAMFHWIARKDGKVVSALSTFIEGDVVSFWNGASLPEVRRQGISTAIRVVALNDAMSKGCRFGISYLMSEGLAFGICSKLGYETKWRFNAFLSP